MTNLSKWMSEREVPMVLPVILGLPLPSLLIFGCLLPNAISVIYGLPHLNILVSGSWLPHEVTLLYTRFCIALVCHMWLVSGWYKRFKIETFANPTSLLRGPLTLMIKGIPADFFDRFNDEMYIAHSNFSKNNYCLDLHNPHVINIVVPARHRYLKRALATHAMTHGCKIRFMDGPIFEVLGQTTMLERKTDAQGACSAQ